MRSALPHYPKEFRFKGEEVGVGRVGNGVLLYPLNDPWAVFFEGAEELSRTDMKPLKREQTQMKRKLLKQQFWVNKKKA